MFPTRNMLIKDHRVYVAGHTGLVGSAILRALHAQGFSSAIVRSRTELDLTNQEAVRQFMKEEKPDYIILAAARVGGILANKTSPASFIYENLMIETNIIHAAHEAGVQNLLFLGSSCIYPKHAAQPIAERALLTGSLEETNAPYAIAKIAGITLCQSFNKQYGTRYNSVMPTNLYGPHDNFDPQTSHVLPALLRRMHEAKLANDPSFEVWGTGKPQREFLHVDDLADACLFLLKKGEHPDLLNIGTGEDLSIDDLAHLIKEIVGYKGSITFNPQYPDGTPRKLLDVSAMTALGWRYRITLRNGILSTYEWCLQSGSGAFL